MCSGLPLVRETESTFYPIVRTTRTEVPQEEHEDFLASYIDEMTSRMFKAIETVPAVRGQWGFTHSLHDGLYIRQCWLPKGLVIVGAPVNKPYLSMLMKGEVSVLTKYGTTRLTGPLIFMVEANLTRLIECHTDVEWSTVHAVIASTEDEAEKELLVGGT